MPKTSHPRVSEESTTARMTAFSPGASPPPVLIASRFMRPTSPERADGSSGAGYGSEKGGGLAAPAPSASMVLRGSLEADGESHLGPVRRMLRTVGALQAAQRITRPGEDVVRGEQAERDVRARGQDPARS